jgi:hypothetical protein
MSDFNAVVKRIATDRSFRADVLKDLKGTLKAHNYTCTPAELAELARLDESKLDQVDESLLNRVVGGVTLTGMPLVEASLRILPVPITRDGGDSVWG